jgi:hypothetical protein
MIDIDYLQNSLLELRADWSEAVGGDLGRVTCDLGALFDDLFFLIGGG